MKKLYLSLFYLVSVITITCAQNLITEDFDFDPVDSLENSNDWNRSGINSVFNIKVVAPGLIYDDYVGSSRGNACQITNDGEGDIVYKNLSIPVTSGSVYMSFMFRVDSLPPTVTQGYIISFNPNTGGTNLNTRFHIKRLSDTTFNTGVEKLGALTFSDSVFQTGRTYLAVLKYVIIDGTSNDSSSLYVFTGGVPQSEPELPLAATDIGDDFTGQGSVYILNNYAQTGMQGCDIKLDGIRVGTSWETSVLAMLTSVSTGTDNRQLQNEAYPNPFHQQLTIKYKLPAGGHVKVNIFDSSGKLTDELTNEFQETGDHEIDWNAGNLPSGTYTYRIQCNGFIIINKLVRIK